MAKQYFTIVKNPIFAGMQFTYPGTTKTKLYKIGYSVVKILFDSKEKDCVIGQQPVKKVFY